METIKEITSAWRRNAPLLRLLVLGFLMLLLQIPIAMIDGQIRERQTTSNQAFNEISNQWGKSQLIVGPRIVFPYTTRMTESSSDGKTHNITTKIRYVSFSPSQLTINGELNVEHRYRGIYEIPVYKAGLSLEGHFTKPDFTTLGIDPNCLQWDRAQLIVHATDTKAIQNKATLQWAGQTLAFKPGNGHMMQSHSPSSAHDLPPSSGIHADLSTPLEDKRYDFSINLEINGTRSIIFAPLGDNTELQLTSNWKDPSFKGEWLPDSRKIDSNGFTAKWHIPNLGRNYSNMWIIDKNTESIVQQSTFGVELFTPINNYRMADRSIKYQILFLMLTFLTLWLFEVLTKTRIHPIQYLMVGAALCLFYLLELSLSEHFGFIAAYIIAAGLVVSQIAVYTWFILKSYRRTAVTGSLLIMLYGYLYVLLQEQDFALLAGTLGLFAVLYVVMFITRNIDWGNLASRQDNAREEASH